MPFIAEEALTSVLFFNICVDTINLKVPGQTGILAPNNNRKGYKAINEIKQAVFNMIVVGLKYLFKKRKEIKNPKY